MNVCKEISQSLKKQVLISEKSAAKINMQESDPKKYKHEVDTFTLRKEDRSSWKKILVPDERSFDLSNPYFKFCLKPENSNNDSHLETTRNSEKLYKCNYSSCKEEERKQAQSFRIIKNWSDFPSASFLNEMVTFSKSYEESAKFGEKKHQEAIQLMKSTDENKDPKKRRHEDETVDSSMLGDCEAARKKILFKTEKEVGMGNPYLEFILKSEDSNPDLNFNGNSEGLCANNVGIDKEEKTREKDKRHIKNGVDIFGNSFTSKDRNKFKVICPHCSKKVPAPGFVRHLTYCMKVSIRKRTRRS